MADEHDDRELGIEFGDLEDELEAVDYPISADQLVERFGEHTLETAGGETTLGEVLEGLDETYDSPEAVHQSVLNMVGREAVGRQRYSDRGVEVDDESEGDGDQESF